MSARRKAPLRLPPYPLQPGTGLKPADDAVYNNVYFEALARLDPDTLDRMRRIKLQDEIVMLRVVMRKVAQQATEEDTTLDAWLKTMNSLAKAATRLARLLSIEITLAKSEDTSLSMLARAIHEKMAEFEP